MLREEAIENCAQERLVNKVVLGVDEEQKTGVDCEGSVEILLTQGNTALLSWKYIRHLNVLMKTGNNNMNWDT